MRGNYTKNSDLDVLFLISGSKFEMKLEYFENTLFDRLLVDPKELMEIISSDSYISSILAHSIGTSQRVIIDSPDIKELIEKCEEKLMKEKITYNKKIETKRKAVDGQVFTIQKKNNQYFLFKGSKKII